MHRGILIDPWLKTITEVKCAEGIEDIYVLLTNLMGSKVGTFTLGSQWPNGDTLYVDDEGLLRPGNRVFMLHGQPLVGNGLILGNDIGGSTRDAASSLVEIQAEVQWTDMETG